MVHSPANVKDPRLVRVPFVLGHTELGRKVVYMPVAKHMSLQAINTSAFVPLKPAGVVDEFI